MYDTGKIIVGLAIFVGLVTAPIWLNKGKAAPKPTPKLDTPVIQQLEKKECVESREFMRSTHMQLLNQWRDQALRKGVRTYINKKGEKILISLQNTCMKCHSNKEQFCDVCHNYTDVKPYCWDCHFIPEGRKTWASTEGHS